MSILPVGSPRFAEKRETAGTAILTDSQLQMFRHETFPAYPTPKCDTVSFLSVEAQAHERGLIPNLQRVAELFTSIHRKRPREMDKYPYPRNPSKAADIVHHTDAEREYVYDPLPRSTRHSMKRCHWLDRR
jgi:hypothetical protein